MNKKTLFLIFLSSVLILPLGAFADITPLVSGMFDNVAELALYIGGSIVVIGWVIAGILYLTAAGSPEKTGIAKKALIAAVIGTVLVVFAAGGYDVIKDIIENVLNAGK